MVTGERLLCWARREERSRGRAEEERLSSGRASKRCEKRVLPSVACRPSAVADDRLERRQALAPRSGLFGAEWNRCSARAIGTLSHPPTATTPWPLSAITSMVANAALENVFGTIVSRALGHFSPPFRPANLPRPVPEPMRTDGLTTTTYSRTPLCRALCCGVSRSSRKS